MFDQYSRNAQIAIVAGGSAVLVGAGVGTGILLGRKLNKRQAEILTATQKTLNEQIEKNVLVIKRAEDAEKAVVVANEDAGKAKAQATNLEKELAAERAVVGIMKEARKLEMESIVKEMAALTEAIKKREERIAKQDEKK